MNVQASKSLYRLVTVGLWVAVVFILWLQRAHDAGAAGATVFIVCIFIPTIAGVHVLANVVLPRTGRAVAFGGWFVLGTLLTALAWGGIIALLRRAEGWPLCAGQDMVSNGGSYWQDVLFSLPSIVVFNLGFCGLRLYFAQRGVWDDPAPAAGEDAPEPAGMRMTGDTIFVKEGESLLQVRVDDILYIEGMQNYVRIHTARQTVTTLQTLTALEGMLPADVFFRTHKSYIVNTDKIERVWSNRLLVGGEELPLSPGKKGELFSRFIDGRLVSK